MIWITKIFSGIKAYSSIAIGAVVVGLWITVKFLAGRNAKLKIENKIATARADHAKEVMEKDKDIDEQADTHLADAVNEINETGASDELSKPNDW